MRRALWLAVVVSAGIAWVGPAQAALITWDDGDSAWNVNTNWNPQQVPNVNGVDDAVIGNGSTVTYPSNSLGNLRIDGGKTLTIANGSTWVQSENTHWTNINTGELVLDNGSFVRTVGSPVIVGSNSNVTAAMTLRNGSDVTIGGEVWLGQTGGTTNQVGTVNMDASAISATALWFWDTDAAGNQFAVNCSGTGASTISVDWLGRRSTTTGQQNNVTWQTMWNEGLLLVGGQGAADGLIFGDHFNTYGNPGPYNGTYTLGYHTAPVTWIAGDGDWNTAASWDVGVVPNPNGGTDVLIGNGATVTYPATALGDLRITGRKTVTIANGSTWQQTTTHWTQINDGTLAVDGGTFERTAGGNVVLAFNSNNSGVLDLTDGARVNIAGEVWLGHTSARTNQTAQVNLNDSAISALALWYWDPDAAGNQFGIDVSGTGTSSIAVDWLGRRAGGVSQNNVTWQTMWSEGLLTFDGQGAADGLSFDDFFVTVGNPGPYNGTYFLRHGPVVWNAGDGDWNTAASWNPQHVPNLNGRDDAIIGNGATVTYPSNSVGDLTLDGGTTLTISGGSTWQQTENTHWTRINTGTLALDNGTFSRPVGGNVVMAFESNESAKMILKNGSAFTVGGELWLGHNNGSRVNQKALVEMSGSDISATALWFWDPDDAGNNFRINFTDLDMASITVDWLGRRDAAHGQQNNVTWEMMWDEGLLSVVNQSGLTGWDFDDYFMTSGNPGPYNGTYTLTFLGIPEPTTLTLLAVGGLGLIARRRRRR